MLIIDIRESKLIDLIKTKAPMPLYETVNLPIGDIIIRHSDSGITYEIILERKCMTDMIASIKDGRYKEQKIRLLAEMNSSANKNKTKTKIAYLLEGSMDELRLPQDKTILIGSIISSTFRDNIPILRTVSLQDTLDMISRLHDRLIKDYKDFFPLIADTLSSLPADTQQHDSQPAALQYARQEIIQNTQNTNIPIANVYLQSIKKNKKDNMTPAVWNMNCLCGIPGVSSAIAIKIAERYPTIRSLLEAYQSCSDSASRELLLADITLTETEKQHRRIGNVISKRIYDYFHA
jgi:crossover junction endonuclease MUS81